MTCAHPVNLLLQSHPPSRACGTPCCIPVGDAHAVVGATSAVDEVRSQWSPSETHPNDPTKEEEAYIVVLDAEAGPVVANEGATCGTPSRDGEACALISELRQAGDTNHELQESDLRSKGADYREALVGEEVLFNEDPSALAKVSSASLSTHLSTEVRRGVRIDRALRQFGTHWTGLAGSASDFELSEQVEDLDDFLSHDWQTGRYSKFATLCLAYNSTAACIASCLVAAAACALQ